MRSITQPGIEDLYREHALGLVRFAPPRPLLVVSAATGRTTAEVPVPRADTVWVDAEATGSVTTFVLAATPNRGGLCNPTYLYTLTLSASGKVASLRPWTYPVVPAEIVSLSASADGGTLAFVYDQCRGPDQEIGIIRGRAMRTWRESYPLNAGDLSLSGDGRELGYTEAPVGGQDARVRVLDTGSAAGSATAASKHAVQPDHVRGVRLAGRQPGAGVEPRGFPLPGRSRDREGHADPDGVGERLGDHVVANEVPGHAVGRSWRYSVNTGGTPRTNVCAS